MINSVRNTVLTVLNKNNYGYISPSDFNLMAKQAQMEVFEEYFADYNDTINRENVRPSNAPSAIVLASNSGYADKKKGIEEAIEIFSTTKFLAHSSGNLFFLPSLTTTGDDYYLLNKVLCYPVLLASGNNTSVLLNSLVDAGANFVALGVAPGDVVTNTTTGATAIATVVTATTITLSADIFTAFPEGYSVFDESVVNEAEKVGHSKITMLNNSLLTSPTIHFPAYTQESDLMSVFPRAINTKGQIQCQYIRYPKDPKWTYVSLTNGEPSFDQSQLDYQDFELPLEDEPKLVYKILQLAGLSIREAGVVAGAKAEEQEL